MYRDKVCRLVRVQAMFQGRFCQSEPKEKVHLIHVVRPQYELKESCDTYLSVRANDSYMLHPISLRSNMESSCDMQSAVRT